MGVARWYLLGIAEEQRQRRMSDLRKRYAKQRKNLIPMQLPDATFISTFRLTKANFNTLCEDLMPFIYPIQRSTAIKPEVKILAALQFYASGYYQKNVGSDFGLNICQASISDIITEVTDALNQPDILLKYIRFPRLVEEMDAVAKKFHDQYGFPGVLGCVDNTHVVIRCPSDYEEAYMCSKSCHSLNVLVICDADLRILHLDASFGGANDDNHIWSLCPAKKALEGLHDKGNMFWFLGDNSYEQSPVMMTPIPNPTPGSSEELYNNAHTTTIKVAEKCIGAFKSRFRCLLANRKLHYTPERAGKIVNACAVLHNIIVDSGVEIDEEAMRLDRECQPLPVPVASEGEETDNCMRQAVINRLLDSQNTDQWNLWFT